MTQFAVRIGSMLLICVAATPVVAGPRGGVSFGGGVHFGGVGGAVAAPHIAAPHVVAPHLSSPSFAPHLSTPHFSTPLPFTTRVGSQRFARPGRLLQSHVTPGQVGSAPLLGSVRQIPRPTNQAANAFALSGVHRFGSGQILRNPFFVNRPVLAHTIFRGRFAQFSSRHHQHFLPIIAVGFIGPLFWPYAYDDFLNYTFYPYAYDAFWPGAYDDVYDGITGIYGSGIAPGYAGSGTGPAYVGRPGVEVSSSLCAGQTTGVTDWRINEIQIVEPDEAQRAALEEFKTAVAKAVDLLRAGCPTDLPSTPTGRIEAMRVRLSAMLEAVRIVRAPLAKFYGLLNDEQKARFNALSSGEDQNEPERRRNLSALCSERASGISSVPMRRLELAVRPDEVQRASLRALQDAIAQAGGLLKTGCPTYRPVTPVVRIDAMEQRLDTMLRAINIVQPALQKFYGSLTDEQKERLNRLAPVQG
jgi:LTXXQ motif family protein